MKRTIVALLALSFNAFAQNDLVRVVSVNGVAKSGDKILTAGAAISKGATIVTAADASLKLLYPDKSLIDVGPSTSFTIKELSENRATNELSSGMVRALIKKRLEKKSDFIIQTKGSVLAVRGTEFSVNVEPGGSGTFKESVTVLEGGVDVRGLASGLEPVRIDAGQKYERAFEATLARTTASQEPPRVFSIKPEEAKREVERVKFRDQTFSHLVQVDANRHSGEMGAAVQGGLQTIQAVAGNFAPPPFVQGAQGQKVTAAGVPSPPPLPLQPGALQQLNPDISNQPPVKVVVTFKP